MAFSPRISSLNSHDVNHARLPDLTTFCFLVKSIMWVIIHEIKHVAR